MKLSSREIVLGLATVTVILFGGVALLARPQFDELKRIRAEQADLRREIAEAKQLVVRRDEFDAEMEELSQRLPRFPMDQKMDTHWLRVMGNVATKHGVKISKRQAGEEKRNGDLYEMGIECKEWESELEPLVHFLFDLQEEGAMLDVQQLLIKPKGNNLLRGRFFLNCAYTRQQDESEE